MQTIDDYDGYLAILVQPGVGHDKQQAFFVAGIAQLLELLENHGDDMTSLACFTYAADLAARLLDLIAQH